MDTSTLLPLLNDNLFALVLTAFGAYGGYLARWVALTGLSQRSLNMAVFSGIQWATKEILEYAEDTYDITLDEVVDKVLAYVLDSVPDALAFLKPSPEALRRKIQANLEPIIHELVNQAADRRQRALEI